MSEGEKNQFNGNLALFRVCAIVYIVNVLNFVFNMSFMAGHGGFFSSLWSALTNSSFEDLLATVGLLIASGVGLLVICACQKEREGAKNIGGAVPYLGCAVCIRYESYKRFVGE